MDSQHNHLHFLLIPLMTQSHIIPLTHFAVSLAKSPAVLRVSILTTPLNAHRHQPSIDAAANPKLHLIPIPFPCRDVGLPPGCESMDALTSPESHVKIFQACELLQSPLEHLIRDLQPRPTCIVSTNAVGWITSRIADSLNIPGYYFETVSCFTITCGHKIRALKENTVLDSEKIRVPDLPHDIEFTKAQLPHEKTANGESDEYMSYVKSQIEQARASSSGLLVNTFHELEPWYVESLLKEKDHKVWCIGPVSLSNSDREISIPADRRRCLNWLDSMEPNSVIYACFGSLCHLSAQQVKQIGTGLEKSNHPFIWIIRSQDCSEEVEDWLKEEKLEEKVEGRGLVVRGWAPQVQILSHVAVGGFLTHCGWNSILEGVCAGVPMVTWPMFAEQFYNDKFVVDVLGIGVRIGVVKMGEFVGWEGVKSGIEELMGESEEGKTRRETSEELARMAKDAMEEGGSSFLNLTMFIQDVLHQIS